MSMVKRTLVLVALVVACGAMPLGAQGQAPKAEQQNEFIPIDQLPPQEQLPAAPLLIAAYSVVLAALFVYIVSISRRLGTVRREVERLETDMKRTGRA